MHNLLEYSGNYFMASGSLRSYYRDEANEDANEVVAKRRFNNNKTTPNQSFGYKTKTIWDTAAKVLC